MVAFENHELEKIQNVNDPNELVKLLEELSADVKEKGDNLYDTGKYAEAYLEYNKIRSLYSKTIEMIEKTDNKDLRYLLRTLKNSEKFWKEYGDGIQQEAKENEALTLWNDAKKLIQNGDYTRALELLDRAFERATKSSNQAGILIEKGNVFFNRGEYGEAIQYYDHAIEQDDKNHVAMANMALSFYRQKKFDEAIQSYKNALKIEPNYFDGLINFGVCYYDLEQFKEARKYFDKAYELDPKNFDANLYKAFGLLGDDKIERSIQYFQEAININPKSIQAQLSLAEAYLLTKQYKLCEQKVEEIMKTLIDPTEVFVARLFLNCCQYHSNAEQANEVSLQLLNSDLNDSIDPLSWDLTDLRVFVDESDEFSSSQKSIILLLIDAFEHKEEREEAKNTLKLLINPERHSIFEKIGLAKDKTEWSFKDKSTPSKFPWYYDWEIFLDESQKRLEPVSSVTYILHPTFPKAIQKMTNKDERFRLAGRAWGSFQVKIKIQLRNNKTPIIRYHWLDVNPTLSK